MTKKTLGKQRKKAETSNIILDKNNQHLYTKGMPLLFSLFFAVSASVSAPASAAETASEAGPAFKDIQCIAKITNPSKMYRVHVHQGEKNLVGTLFEVKEAKGGPEFMMLGAVEVISKGSTEAKLQIQDSKETKMFQLTIDLEKTAKAPVSIYPKAKWYQAHAMVDSSLAAFFGADLDLKDGIDLPCGVVR
jgi:hypothetical protein